jgi:hypothetical protein
MCEVKMELLTEICRKPRKQSVMTPISTKMSINHGPHCSVLEECSPRDCLHVHKDTNGETKVARVQKKNSS